jgi:hypothetical protein
LSNIFREGQSLSDVPLLGRLLTLPENIRSLDKFVDGKPIWPDPFQALHSRVGSCPYLKILDKVRKAFQGQKSLSTCK